MGVYKRGKVWWYRFTWNQRQSGRAPSRRTNVSPSKSRPRTKPLWRRARWESATVPRSQRCEISSSRNSPLHRSALPHQEKHPGLLSSGNRNLTASLDSRLQLDKISVQDIAAYVRTHRDAGLQVTSVNRQLEVLRRMFELAEEWDETEKRLPRVEMLGGERHRDRVLSTAEEDSYLAGAAAVGVQIRCVFTRARWHPRPAAGEASNSAKRSVPAARHCDRSDGLRTEAGGVFPPSMGIHPRRRVERSFWENRKRPKDDSAERPGCALNGGSKLTATSDWVFPAPTKSGHIEKSTLKKPHAKAYTIANVASFPLYTFRHTCLTRWAAHMDPYTLGVSCRPQRFATTRRYIHPQAQTVLAAMERARAAQGGHKTGHSADTDRLEPSRLNLLYVFENGKDKWSGREDSNLRPPGPEPGALPG